MQYITIQVPGYIRQFMKKRFDVVDGCVVLPAYSLAWYAIMNGACVRPEHEKPVEGNVTVALKDCYVYKNLDYCNWLSPSKLLKIESLLVLEFDMTLREYMERQLIDHGVNYESSAYAFHRMYGLEGLIEEESLMKKHTRWKHTRREFRKNKVQLELNI